MAENPLLTNVETTEKNSSKFPRWLFIAILILLIGLCCIIVAVVVIPIFKVNFDAGGYSIERVTLSSDLKDNQPVDITDIFMPSDTIICTVKTSGVDGIIGMRWYLGDKVVYEATGKTENNTVSTFIQN